MNNEQFITRLKYLRGLLEMLRKENISAPEGYLRIADRKHKPQYYHVTEQNKPNGSYIRKKDRPVAAALAQKDYYDKLQKEVIREIDAIEEFLKKMPGQPPEEVYGNLHAARQQLISPLAVSNEQYADQWLKIQYNSKGFRENDVEYFSNGGLRVRSKSEALIADMLQSNNIPFKYEAPLYIKGAGEIYPDFTLLNLRTRQEIYYEHFGMMDKEAYVDDFFWKMHQYTANNIILGKNLIVSFESSNNPLNIRDLKTMILKHLE